MAFRLFCPGGKWHGSDRIDAGTCAAVPFDHGSVRALLKSTMMVFLGVAVAMAPAAAAPAKKKPAAKARTIVKPVPKLAPPVPVIPEVRGPGGFMVPREVVLTSPNLAEREANAVWNLRAALNVAALQCQFSPWLRTVKTYNSFLQAHSEELVRAQKTMVAHFRKVDGARAMNSFDMYTTRTYNSFSTLDAQYAFCNAAGYVGRQALAVPKGKLGASAIADGPAIRAALSYAPLAPALALVYPDPVVLPDFMSEIA